MRIFQLRISLNLIDQIASSSGAAATIRHLSTIFDPSLLARNVFLMLVIQRKLIANRPPLLFQESDNMQCSITDMFADYLPFVV